MPPLFDNRGSGNFHCRNWFEMWQAAPHFTVKTYCTHLQADFMRKKTHWYRLPSVCLKVNKHRMKFWSQTSIRTVTFWSCKVVSLILNEFSATEMCAVCLLMPPNITKRTFQKSTSASAIWVTVTVFQATWTLGQQYSTCSTYASQPIGRNDS